MAEVDRAALAAANNAKCPEFAKVMEEFRRVFGPGVRATYVKEGDVELGKKQVVEKFLTADQYIRLGQYEPPHKGR